MDDRYADDEYRSSYPEPSEPYPSDPYPSGEYPSGEYPSGQYAAYDDQPYYADDQGSYQPGDYPDYGYDDTPPASDPAPVPASAPARSQPKIEVLDVDGVRAVEIGTLVWLVGFVALLPFWSPLRSHGYTWWIWTCLAGFGLGAIGIELTRRLRARRAAHEGR